MCLVSSCSRLARRVGLEFRKRSYGQPNHFQSTSSLSSSYDYVIVGAGSAGCVLANRLSADPGSTVLLLEAGPNDNTWKIRMPAAMEYNIANDKYNWFYTTEPQENLQNRSIYHPRGRVWGGSSSLNAMIYMRGHALDYDRWDTHGASGWSYADCLPYFKKAETYELGADEYRGGEGPLFVSRGKPNTPLDVAFLDAAVQAGYSLTKDMNGYQQEGFGPMDKTIYKGRRWNTASAYLRPALPRQNLVTETGSLVDRVLFESNKAVGVNYRVGDTTKCARAAKDVILCGGAINSPQLLMLSGIGNANELKELGIPVVYNLPGVGQNLQDHMQLYIQYECTQPVSLHSTLQWQNKILAGVRWLMFKSGPCATSHIESGGFIRSDSHVTHPDIEIQFLPLCLKEVGKPRIQGHGFQLCVEILRPTSSGFVKLRSRDPLQHPSIQPNYLVSQNDIQLLRTCVRAARHLVGRKAFDPYRGKELRPGPGCNTDDEVDSFIRAFAKTDYHPCGTCKMGADHDPTAVVDSQTRVFGVDNLRVVDASIMPSIISGNLNAPTIMIAEKAADYILGREMLPKIRPPVY